MSTSCAILDLRTGEFAYSNAGHNPPLLIRADGHCEWLELPKGIALGVMDEASYTTRTAVLRPGDHLLSYTDGVTEAKNIAGELFTEPKLLESAAGFKGSAATLLHNTLLFVRTFADGAEQSDDITVLSVNYRGKPS